MIECHNEVFMKDAVLYIHGKGGSDAESGHYRPLFPGHEVIGLDYQSTVPWDAGKEIRAAVEKLKEAYESIILIANSIGAYFSMNAGIDAILKRVYFISPIVDMERLIFDMMVWSNVTEEQLKAERVIATDFGESLSWDYLCYVREHPVKWKVPTEILYGSKDNLTSYETITTFAKDHRANLTVMENGEHWFHTEEQMRFLDEWIKKCESVYPGKILIKTERLRLYPASREQMEDVIASEQDKELKKAYSEMMDGCLRHPEQWQWYAMWMIELRDGTHIGDLNFKGIGTNGTVEIGYGIFENYQRKGYATEAADAAVTWALQQPAVTRVEAETEPGNRISQHVLEKCGFRPTGSFGKEGPRFYRVSTQ